MKVRCGVGQRRGIQGFRFKSKKFNFKDHSNEFEARENMCENNLTIGDELLYIPNEKSGSL